MLTQLCVSNKNSLMFAREMCLKQILESSFYNENHNEFLFENDADIVAHKQYRDIMNDNNLDLLNDINFFDAYSSISDFIINTDTRDGKKHFEYDTPQVKEDITIEILDSTITTDYIEKYPILQKEYNLDGTKKSALELIINLNNEINQICSMKKLDNNSKELLLKDTKEMYYELIYRELEKNPNSINEVKENIGEQLAYNIINEILSYFEEEKEMKLEKCKILLEVEDIPDDIDPMEQYEKDINKITGYYNQKKEVLLKLRSNKHTTITQSNAMDTIKKISPSQAVKNALRGTTEEKTNEANKVEELELNQENTKEGETK